MIRFVTALNTFFGNFSESGLHADELREVSELSSTQLSRAGENQAKYVHNTFAGLY